MPIYVSTLITLIALIYYGALLIIVLRQKNFDRPRLFFSLYLLSMIVWSFTAFMIFADLKIMDALFWNRLLIVGSIGMPISFLNFVLAFLKKESKVWLIAGGVCYLIAQVLNLAGQVIASASINSGLLTNEYGSALTYVSLLFVVFIGASAWILINEYRHSKNAIYRNRLRYLLLVIIVIFSGNLTNLTDLKMFPGDIAGNVISAMLITFAIFRHHLLDISLVVRKGLLYSIPTALIGVVYFMIIQGILLLFPSIGGVEIMLLSLSAAVLTALVIQPLRDRAQTLVDRFFFREKYNASVMLQHISQTAAFVLDVETLTQMIVTEVTNTLHIGRAAFLIKWQESGEFYLSAHRGFNEDFSIRWTRDNPIAQVLAHLEKPLTSPELILLPAYQQLSFEERAELDRLGGELFIPLKVKADLVGIFILGLKLSEQTFTEDDQMNLSTLANQTAVAVENARLFSAEQSRREELDALYDLSRQLVVTNEVDDVIQSTTRHVVISAHVTFARIVTPDVNGGFYCRAAYPIRTLDYDLGIERFEPTACLPFYQRVVKERQPIFLRRTDLMDHEARQALMLDLANTVCLSPLRVGDDFLGLLILGERRESQREPFDVDKMRLITAIADQAANALQRARLHEQMENTFLETALALATAMDARDTYTQDHSDRISKWAEKICLEIHCDTDEVWSVQWAARLHDIGKIGVPDEILRKNGPLTPEDWQSMRKHPEIGSRIVEPIKKLANVAPLIKAHHEWYDGNGYPLGLKGNEIPLGARILSIADAYGAMLDNRTYHRSRTPIEAINEMRDKKGTQFDPELVEVFASIIEKEKSKAPAEAGLISSLKDTP